MIGALQSVDNSVDSKPTSISNGNVIRLNTSQAHFMSGSNKYVDLRNSSSDAPLADSDRLPEQERMNCAQFAFGKPGFELPASRFVTDPMSATLLFQVARSNHNNTQNYVHDLKARRRREVKGRSTSRLSSPSLRLIIPLIFCQARANQKRSDPGSAPNQNRTACKSTVQSEPKANRNRIKTNRSRTGPNQIRTAHSQASHFAHRMFKKFTRTRASAFCNPP